MVRIAKLVVAICATFALAAWANGNEILYKITDLGTLGGPTSSPNAISQNGVIVGGAEVPQRGDYPFVYQGNGPMQNLGLLDPVNGVVGSAQSVNSKGQVVGLSDAAMVNGTEIGHAFYYGGSGSLVDLTPGSQQSVAWCINENSQIVGSVQTASGAIDGMFWTIGGATVDLGPGFLPDAINDQRLMGGLATQTQHAALYSLSSGSITDLGTFGGAKSYVNAISDSGLAVGFADTPTTSHAFLYNVNTGVLTDLGNPVTPLFYSDADSVNNLGAVVGGYSLDASSAENVAFIYTQAGGMQNLNNLIDPSSGAGWNLTGCGGINDAGQIVASGYNPQGEFHAFLLTPVPEPSSLCLLCSAIFGVVAIQAGARLLRSACAGSRSIRFHEYFPTL